MQRTYLQLIILSSLTALLACSSLRLSNRGAAVRLARNAAISGDCQPIGNVESVAKTTKEAEILIRNQAGELNASLVAIVNELNNDGSTALQGKAYSCPVVPPNPSDNEPQPKNNKASTSNHREQLDQELNQGNPSRPQK